MSEKLGRYLQGVVPVTPTRAQSRPWESALEDTSYLDVTTEKSYRRGRCSGCSKPYARLEEVVVDRRDDRVKIYHTNCY